MKKRRKQEKGKKKTREVTEDKKAQELRKREKPA